MKLEFILYHICLWLDLVPDLSKAYDQLADEPWLQRSEENKSANKIDKEENKHQKIEKN